MLIDTPSILKLKGMLLSTHCNEDNPEPAIDQLQYEILRNKREDLAIDPPLQYSMDKGKWPSAPARPTLNDTSYYCLLHSIMLNKMKGSAQRPTYLTLKGKKEVSTTTSNYTPKEKRGVTTKPPLLHLKVKWKWLSTASII